MANIAVIGGRFAHALAHRFALAHQVTLFDRSEERVKAWRQAGEANLAFWMEKIPFPPRLAICHTSTFRAPGYDLTILATTTDDLDGVAGLDWGTSPLTVLVQKGLRSDGLLPHQAFKAMVPSARILLFTGAAFAEELILGAYVHMLVTGPRSLEREMNYFRSLLDSGIIPEVCYDPDGLAWCHIIRTVTSMEAGIARGYLGAQRKNFSGTMEAIYEGIHLEGLRLARYCGVNPWTLRDGQPSRRVLDVDFRMCLEKGRNATFGYWLGLGKSPEYAQSKSDGVVEVASSLERVVAKLSRHKRSTLERKFPYLMATADLMAGTKSVEECAQIILNRRSLRFSR